MTFLQRGATSALAFSAMMCGIQAHAADCRFDRSVPVSSNGSLDASTGSGNLRVVPGNGNRVHVIGHVQSQHGWFGGNNDADVQRICNNPPIEQNGKEVRVGRMHPDWFRNISVDYYIEVPRSFAVAANSGSGNVEVHDLTGTVVSKTGSGDIRVYNLSAGTEVGTGSGGIDADNLGGNTRLTTGSGDIRARFATPGEVKASTGSGSIHLQNVRGALFASTGSGDVEVSGKPDGAWRIGSASGSVRLHLPQGTGFNLDANASSGDVETPLPATGDGKHHARGPVAGGGPEVHVETSSGDIRVD